MTNPWTVILEARLERLWREGVTTQKIAADLGTSKNSVIGKAHSLGLPPRQSPIIRVYGPPPPPKASRFRRPEQPTIPKVRTVAPAPAAPAAPMKPRYAHCQFIKNAGFPWLFCDHPADRGTYCSDHHTQCHQKIIGDIDLAPWLPSRRGHEAGL